MAERKSGKVKWYNKDKGFGFIIPDAGGADVFLHKSALDAANIPGLLDGQLVEYSIQEGRKPGDKPKACDISLIK